MTVPYLAFLSLLLTATAALAVGPGWDDEDTPPEPTETSETCVEGQIWDEMQSACVDATESRFDDDRRFRAVRELAHSGQYDRARQVIAAADTPQDPRFLNYAGFVSRKSGNIEAALLYYRKALEIKPDYILARSYLGQAFIDLGDIESAQAELRAIRTYGGRDSWAYVSLKQALSGKAVNY